MKPIGFHDGDRSEYLAAYVFDTIGYSVPVPRQQDRFLIDMFVHLAQDDKTLHVPTGSVFAVQVKSEKTPIGIKQEHFAWLAEFKSPLFVCVINKSTQTFEIYQTLARIPAVHESPKEAIAFYFYGKSPQKIKISDKIVDCKPVRLGKPITRLSFNDLDHQDPEKRRQYRKNFFLVMQGWAILETTVLAWKQFKLPFIAFPPYKTNKLINFKDLKYATYGNQSDISPASSGIVTLLISYRIFLEKNAQAINVSVAPILDHIEKFLSGL